MDVRRLEPSDVALVASIDRSEHVEIQYRIEDGRLVEAVIGIGINVNWPVTDMPREVRDRATSLLELAGHPMDRVALLSALLAALDAAVAALERGESPVARLAGVSALDGRHVTVDLGSERLVGRAAGVSEQGLLLLDTDAGRVALAVGEVLAVRDAPQPDAALGVGAGA